MSEMTCLRNEPACACLESDLMALLGRKYVLELVCLVGIHGQVRFSEIEDHLPAASTSTLSNRLAELTDEGLIERRKYDEIPPRVEYELTDEGATLADRLDPLVEWLAESG